MPSYAFADAVLLLGEPYGRFGSFSPTGHAAVYLTGVCAQSPTALRRCEAGESGVVVSRYHRVGGVDWAAVPLIPYLYGVERAADAPAFAGKDVVLALRNAYRQAHFTVLVPDAADGRIPRGDWVQLVGAAYDRSIVAFSIRTTAAQDDEVIAHLNRADNESNFNILSRNCADFARDVIHLYYPGTLRSNVIADLGVTTPKQIAKSLVALTTRRPELALSAFVIPQIPGSRRQSGRAKGVLEALLKSKKYVIPLAVAQPWVPVGLAAGYFARGRFDPKNHAEVHLEPQALELRAARGGDTAPERRDGHEAIVGRR